MILPKLILFIVFGKIGVYILIKKTLGFNEYESNVDKKSFPHLKIIFFLFLLEWMLWEKILWICSMTRVLKSATTNDAIFDTVWPLKIKKSKPLIFRISHFKFSHFLLLPLGMGLLLTNPTNKQRSTEQQL